jgi:hypothetical protein
MRDSGPSFIRLVSDCALSEVISSVQAAICRY